MIVECFALSGDVSINAQCITATDSCRLTTHNGFFCLACIPSADRASARIKVKVYKTVVRVVTCGLAELQMLMWNKAAGSPGAE